MWPHAEQQIKKMTITSYQDLTAWFVAKKGSKPAPFWNLYGMKYGRSDQVVHRNVDVSDIGESARLLEESVRMLSPANEAPARFKLSVYAEGQANNPVASVEVQIQNSAAPATAGIAGLPPGVGSINELIADKIKTERLQWELDLLKEQMSSPSDKWERIFEHVSGLPGIDKVLQAVAVGLVSKFNPSALPAIQAAMNGTPEAPSGGPIGDDEGDPNAVFIANVQEAANALGTDPVTMAKKLNQLVKSQPELAKQLMQQ